VHRQLIRTFSVASLLAVTLPSLASAQGPGGLAIGVAPQSTVYNIGTGAGKTSVTQTAVPIVF